MTRTLTFLTVKRTGPRLFSPYGHWWIEAGMESYGWWPDRPLRLRHWFTGTGGCLNGTWLNRHASPTRDALHGVPADHRFHPMLIRDKSDEQVRRDIRAFAQAYQGNWGWQWPWSNRPVQNCRTFQLDLFAAVGLAEPPGLLFTHGSGCPFIFPARRLGWSLIVSVPRWRPAGRPHLPASHS